MGTGVLTKATIRLDVEATDWQDAIRQVGALLVADDAVQEAYVNAMIRAVEAKGPYIVVAPGIALPHASPDYAKRIALGVIRLKTPVVFHQPEYDPVDLLFCLASADFLSHVSTLVSLTLFIENKAAVEVLRMATDVETALGILEKGML
jgi:mannitol/fructose-specific phosphotransferase system IIA component (Ntr-type)